MEKEKIKSLIKKHETYKLSGINLIASENRLSDIALNALSSDLAGRYNGEYYGGTKYANEICEVVETYAKKLFSANHVFVTPISGNICDLAVIFAFTVSGDKIVGIPKEHGGYPFAFEKFQRKFSPFPMKDYCIDIEKLERIGKDVSLIMIASSVAPFPHPIEKVSAKSNCTLVYDASHTLGLVAGGRFQQPLSEGSDILIGSTHKSFPGPQGGIIATNNSELAYTISKYLFASFDEGVGLIDNPHVHRIACLGIVMEYMIEKGKAYADQIVRNAKTLAQSLHDLNVPVKFSDRGFTESHQVLLHLEQKKILGLYKGLEKNHIFIDCFGRLGVAEVTFVGMKEEEMQKIAHMIAEVYRGKDNKEKAIKLAMQFYL